VSGATFRALLKLTSRSNPSPTLIAALPTQPALPTHPPVLVQPANRPAAKIIIWLGKAVDRTIRSDLDLEDLLCSD
jgi:hypothetical protein